MLFLIKEKNLYSFSRLMHFSLLCIITSCGKKYLKRRQTLLPVYHLE